MQAANPGPRPPSSVLLAGTRPGCALAPSHTDTWEIPGDPAEERGPTCQVGDGAQSLSPAQGLRPLPSCLPLPQHLLHPRCHSEGPATDWAGKHKGWSRPTAPTLRPCLRQAAWKPGCLLSWLEFPSSVSWEGPGGECLGCARPGHQHLPPERLDGSDTVPQKGLRDCLCRALPAASFVHSALSGASLSCSVLTLDLDPLSFLAQRGQSCCHLAQGLP